MSRPVDTGLAAGPLRRVTAALCVTQIIGWGVLYYAFTVLSPQISADTGWPAGFVVGCFTGALTVSALAGIYVGRVIDRRGPRWVMTAGSLLAVVAVPVIATAPNAALFVVGWLLAGIAMSGVLYPPAFAALTGWGGARRVRALTTVTLVGGLASTVFAPLTGALATHFDWRGCYLVLTALLLAAVPIHAVALRYPWTPPVQRHWTGDSNRVRAVTSSRAFVVLTLCLAAMALGTFGLVANLVPLLESRGFTTQLAAAVLAAGGLGQAIGRFGYARLAAVTGTLQRTAGAWTAVALTTASLAVVSTPVAVVFALSLLAGAARGINTLIQATAVVDRWGTTGFGAINGALSAPATAAAALAPWVGTALAHLFSSYGAALGSLAGLTMVAALAARFTMPQPVTEDRPGDGPAGGASMST